MREIKLGEFVFQQGHVEMPEEWDGGERKRLMIKGGDQFYQTCSNYDIKSLITFLEGCINE